jgi:hypothetical protein
MLGQVIGVVDIAAGNLTFTPVAGENGVGYDSFEFRVHDGTAYSSSDYTMTVDVTPENQAPVVGNQAFSVAEDSAAGSVVGTVVASDADAGDTLFYAITAGDPEGVFAIDVATGEITVADAGQLDFETTPVFNLTVTVTDSGGLTATGSISIALDEASDPPVEEIPEEADDPVEDPEEETEPEADPPSPDEIPASPVADTALPQVSTEPLEQAVDPSRVDLSQRPDIRYEARSDALSVARAALGVFERVFEDEPLIAPGASLTDLISQQDDFMEELDRLKREIESFVGPEMAVAGASIAVTMGLSIGYVIWLTRGGLLLASLLSSLPAWRLIDPIAVLAFVGTDEEDDGEDGESLDSLLSRSSSLEETRVRGPGPKGIGEHRSEPLGSGEEGVSRGKGRYSG